jgi:hypothetical protein
VLNNDSEQPPPKMPHIPHQMHVRGDHRFFSDTANVAADIRIAGQIGPFRREIPRIFAVVS